MSEQFAAIKLYSNIPQPLDDILSEVLRRQGMLKPYSRRLALGIVGLSYKEKYPAEEFVGEGYSGIDNSVLANGIANWLRYLILPLVVCHLQARYEVSDCLLVVTARRQYLHAVLVAFRMMTL